MPNTRFLKLAMTMDSLGSQPDQRPCVRILLIDDSKEILDHISNMLQPEYDVIGKVADGNLVCSKVASLSPDIIILDISMGNHSGIEIAHRLREQDSCNWRGGPSLRNQAANDRRSWIGS
jgi:PleD family two-component response regulator